MFAARKNARQELLHLHALRTWSISRRCRDQSPSITGTCSELHFGLGFGLWVWDGYGFRFGFGLGALVLVLVSLKFFTGILFN